MKSSPSVNQQTSNQSTQCSGLAANYRPFCSALVLVLFLSTLSVFGSEQPFPGNLDAQKADGDSITIMLPGDVPLVLVRVPAGTFLMGSPDGERGNVFANERQHQVTLTKDYYIGQTEITQLQWTAVMDESIETACASSGNVADPLVGVGDDHAMYCTNYDRIAGSGGFLEKLNEHLESTRFRLPTEAEWERACRAETTTRFWHGDVLECGDDCDACPAHEESMWWCGDDSSAGPKPVGQKDANPFGLYDMHGNVFEVVNDRYADDYGNPSGGAVTDPTGPATTGDVTFKGGGWDNEAWFGRSAIRLGVAHGDQGQNDTVGFRLAACAGPSISSEPASSTIGSGQEATLSVVATANDGTLSYQWYTGMSGDTSSALSGETSDTITASPETTTSYWVQVTDDCASTDSETATITVDAVATLDYRYFFPAAAKASGAEGSFFLTDATVNNAGDVTASYAFQWLPRSSNNFNAAQSETFTVEPGTSVVVADVLGAAFGLEDGAVGSLAVVSDSMDLLLMSRTYNQVAKAGGTFGQAFAGHAMDNLIMADMRKRIIFFVENDSFRTNLGLMNGTRSSIRIEWERFTPDGVSVETGGVNLPPWGNTQINTAFAGEAPVNGGYVDVWTTTEDGMFAAYGSLLDNITSDPTTIVPQ